MTANNNLEAESSDHEWSSDIPSMIEETVSRYKSFVAANGQENHNAKSFRDYHVACRSALAHLEQLIKLSNWAGEGARSSTGIGGNVDQLIARAQAALESSNIEDEENG